MTIKKQSSGVSVDTASNQLKVEFVDSIKLTLGETIIDLPGEYELSGVSITALELPNPDYVKVVDFLAIRSEGIDLGIVFSDKGSNKEFLKDLANIDILVIGSDITVENVKKLLTMFEPEYLVLLGGKESEQVKKDFNINIVTEDKSLKVKEADFPRGESIQTKAVILSK